MTIDLSTFLSQLVSNPALLITFALTLGVILVNGWTDAPNAIATCVSTRAIKPRSAILMAAVCNFLGVLVMTKINATVAQTISNMVDFGGDAHEALIALCAALFAIVIWATAAWCSASPPVKATRSLRAYPVRQSPCRAASRVSTGANGSR